MYNLPYDRAGSKRIAIMDIKLALLYLIISAMMTLSYLEEGKIASMKQQLLR
jgi:hypothetical protein